MSGFSQSRLSAPKPEGVVRVDRFGVKASHLKIERGGEGPKFELRPKARAAAK